MQLIFLASAAQIILVQEAAVEVGNRLRVVAFTQVIHLAQTAVVEVVNRPRVVA